MSAMSCIIRTAGPQEAGTVSRLLAAFNAEFDSPCPDPDTLTRRFTRLLGRDDVIVLLALVADDPVGFAYLTLRPTPYHDGPLAQLEELYVGPELRDQGIGTRLVEELLALLRERGAGEIHIGVDEGDTDTRRFYERHGFTNVEPGGEERMLLYLREL